MPVAEQRFHRCFPAIRALTRVRAVALQCRRFHHDSNLPCSETLRDGVKPRLTDIATRDKIMS
jgi:hypothetical protein